MLRSMDIRFCDICNESIPVADLANGKATEHKGRLVCASCELAMTSAARVGGAEVAPPLAVGPPAPKPPVAATPAGEARSDGVALALAAVALIGVGAVAYLARQEVDRVARDGAHERAALVAGWNSDRSAADSDRRARNAAFEAALGERDAALANAREDLIARAHALEDRIAGAESRIAALAAELAARDTAAGGDPIEARLGRLEGALDLVREDVGVLTRTLLDTLERGVEFAGASPQAPPPPQDPAWHDWLPRLGSSEPFDRLDAIEALGRTRDVGVVEHIATALADSNVFVRMAAARVLGELGSGQAVPALIDALEDAEVGVREAAIVSLRQLTSRSMAFDPAGTAGERARQVQAWRDWWRRTGGE